MDGVTFELCFGRSIGPIGFANVNLQVSCHHKYCKQGMTDDDAGEKSMQCDNIISDSSNIGNVAKDAAESMRIIPVECDENHRGEGAMRSASERLLREYEKSEVGPRSQTWNGILDDNCTDNGKTDQTSANNYSKPSQQGNVNQVEAPQVTKCSAPNPDRCSSTKKMMHFDNITQNQSSFCQKCEKKRRKSTKLPEATNDGKMFKSVKTFVICLSLLQLVQVMGSGYSKSALTSIERRYRLSSFSVGILQSCFHVGNLSVILFVSYYGSKWNRPRAIAIGSLLMALSSFLSAMPQFVGSPYRVEDAENEMDLNSAVSASYYSKEAIISILNRTQKSSAVVSDYNPVSPVSVSDSRHARSESLLSRKKSRTRLCARYPIPDFSGFAKDPDSPAMKENSNSAVLSVQYTAPKVAHLKSSEKVESVVTEGEESAVIKDETEEDDSWNDSKLYIFIAVGSVLKGMGHSPLHPLGMSFVDDFATPRNSAVYIGVVSALSLLGPAFGFILGSLTTGIWVDWAWVDTSTLQIGPHHPLWVGAWWMGYLVTAFLLLMATIPFCMFPREIPKEKEEEEDSDEAIVTCFDRFSLCCNFRAGEKPLTDQSVRNPLNRDADDACTNVSQKNACSCYITFIEDENTAKNNRTGSLGKELQHFSGDKFKPYTESKGLDFPDNLSVTFDEEQAAQLISYLEHPLNGSAGVRSDATSFEIPLSYSEIKFSSTRSHSMTSPPNIQMKKSASVHGAEHKRLAAEQQNCFFNNKILNASNMTNTRRTSRLEKLKLFDFTASLKGLLTDTVFLSITLAFVCLTSFLAASVTYVSKYMEVQFSITASFANLLNGSVNLPMAVVGNFLGGWLIRRFNLNVRRTMAVVVTGLAMTIICVAALLLFKCSEASNVNYSTGAEGGKCAASCNCGDDYSPVCDVTTNVTYRSPCHAGCNDVTSLRKTKVYSGCRCMINNLPSNGSFTSMHPEGGILFRGPCHRPDCSRSLLRLPVFLGVMGTASLTAGLASTPSSLVILRIVPPAEKAFAIGIVFVFTRILAWIPAPVYAGYAIDAACLRWSHFGGLMNEDESASSSTNGERNHCEVYDKDRLRRNFFAVTGGLVVLSLLFYILALYLQTRRLKIRRKKLLERREELNFNSPLLSDKSPTMTSPLRREQQFSMTSETDKSTEFNDRTQRDKNFNDFLSPEDQKLILSSALETPFKLVLSVSAPALASHACELKVSAPIPQTKDNVIRATAV